MVLAGPPTHLQERVTNHMNLVEFREHKEQKLYQTVLFVEVGGWEYQLGIRLTQSSLGLAVAELGKIPLLYI